MPSDPQLASPPRRQVTGVYFDGRTSAGRSVDLAIDNCRVRVDGDGINRDEPIGAVEISPPLGSSPRVVRFSDGAFCEVADVAELGRMLAAAGVGETRHQWAERAPWFIPAAIAIMVALAVAGYFVGLPFMARVAAERLPASALDRLSGEVLGVLDGRVFEPSELPRERQDAIRRQFAMLELLDVADVRHTIEFRSSELGPNAMALPSGLVIVTDDLVKVSRSHDEVVAVLAHEMGHVYGRHALRNIIQSSVVSLVVVWFLGDVSTVVAAVPTALLETKYSRDFEREADDYAARVLRANGIPAARLAEALESIQRHLEESGSRNAATPGLLDYLSSHPATSERINRLKERPAP